MTVGFTELRISSEVKDGPDADKKAEVEKDFVCLFIIESVLLLP